MNPPTPARVEGCREDVPTVSMNPDAHYSLPRYWDKTILGRPLTDAAIERYRRRGWYGRAVLKAPGCAPLGRLVWSA